jgi:hypothetical protein
MTTKAASASYPITHKRTRIRKINVRLSGAGAAVPTNDDSGKYNNPLDANVAIARSGAGAYTFTLLEKFTECIGISTQFQGATAGLQARIVSYDATTGAVSIVCEVNITATDLAASTKLFLEFTVATADK